MILEAESSSCMSGTPLPPQGTYPWNYEDPFTRLEKPRVYTKLQAHGLPQLGHKILPSSTVTSG